MATLTTGPRGATNQDRGAAGGIEAALYIGKIPPELKAQGGAL